MRGWGRGREEREGGEGGEGVTKSERVREKGGRDIKERKRR